MAGTTPDLIRLDKLTEEKIVETLRLRFASRLIYTYIGPILISVNPFENITDLYSAATSARYVDQPLDTLPPHLFALADNAYSDMKMRGTNQSIVISGDSGSGKTESNRRLTEHLLRRSGQRNKIEELVLTSNQLLESFGNAKTTRNDNSSRFARYNELQFDWHSRVVGAKTIVYLLEKSRITRPQTGQRNYHSFYQLLAGGSGFTKKEYDLAGLAPSKFKYLSVSACYDANGIDDHEWFTHTDKALRDFGFVVEDVYRLLAVVLHLGNITFAEKKGACMITSKESLATVCRLMGVTEAVFNDSCCNKLTIVQREHIFSPLTVPQAESRRDALAKALYARLFDKIVTNINEAICNEGRKTLIGLLDIFGFEDFGEQNSFEQLCINLANEQMQQFFNDVVFRSELEEYERENVLIHKVKFNDNEVCVNLIVGKNGVFQLLNDETYFPKATDETFLESCHSKLVDNPCYEILKRDRKTAFVIKHYAGPVKYQCEDFLEKNRDTMSQELLCMVGRDSCRFSFLALLFEDDLIATVTKQGFDRRTSKVVHGADPTTFRNTARRRSQAHRHNNELQPVGQRKRQVENKFPTVCLQFKDSLRRLVDALSETNARFVRCIKPSTTSKPRTFDEAFVTKQCSYTGILESVKIRRIGFGDRMPFSAFMTRYGLLQPTNATMNHGIKKSTAVSAFVASASGVSCKELLEVVYPDRSSGPDAIRMWAIGKTKVFLRDEVTLVLERKREEAMTFRYIVFLQRAIRRWLVRLRANKKVLEERAREKLAQERLLEARRKLEDEKRQAELERQRALELLYRKQDEEAARMRTLKEQSVDFNKDVGRRNALRRRSSPGIPIVALSSTSPPNKRSSLIDQTVSEADLVDPTSPVSPTSMSQSSLTEHSSPPPPHDCGDFRQHFIKAKGYCCNCFQLHPTEATQENASPPSTQGKVKPGKLKPKLFSSDVMVTAMLSFQAHEAEADLAKTELVLPAMKASDQWCKPYAERLAQKFEDVVFIEIARMRPIIERYKNLTKLESTDFNILYNAMVNPENPNIPRSIFLSRKTFDVKGDARRKEPGLILWGKGWQHNGYIFIASTYQLILMVYKESRLPINASSFYDTVRASVDQLIEEGM